MKKSQKIILAVCLAVSVIAIVAIVCILARRPEPIEDNIGGNVNNSGDLVTSSGDEMYLNVTKKVGDIEISDIKITLIEKNNCRIEAKVKNTGDKFLESTNIEIKASDKQKELLKKLYTEEELKQIVIENKVSKLSELGLKIASDLISERMSK